MADKVLDIEARVRDLASSALKRVGDAGKAAGDRVAEGMRKAETAQQRVGGASVTLGKDISKARIGLGAMALAMGQMGVEADSAVGKATRLASSLAGGYAAGGPAGVALVALTSGLGALSDMAGQAHERAVAAFNASSKSLATFTAQAEAGRATIQSLRLELLAMKGALDGVPFDQKGAGLSVSMEEQRAKVGAARAAAAAARQKAMEDLRTSQQPLSFLDQSAFGDTSWRGGAGLQEARGAAANQAIAAYQAARQVAEQQEEALRILQQQAAVHRELTTREQVRARDAEMAAEREREGADEAARHAAEVERADAALETFTAGMHTTTAEYERQQELLGRHLATYERLADLDAGLAEQFKAAATAQVAREKSEKAQAEALKKQQEAREKSWATLGETLKKSTEQARANQEANLALTDQVALLKAADEWERRRLEIHQDLREALENEATKANAQVLLQERLAALEKERAADAEKAAKAAADKANAVQREAQAAREAQRGLDITQKFADMGGGFGFGKGIAGQGLGDVRTPVTILPTRNMAAEAKAAAAAARAAASATPTGGVKSAGAGDVQVPDLSKLPDPKPELQRMAAELRKVPGHFERMTAEAKRTADTTRSSVKEVGDATVRAVADLKKGQDEIRADVRRIKDQLSAAARGGGA